MAKPKFGTVITESFTVTIKKATYTSDGAHIVEDAVADALAWAKNHHIDRFKFKQTTVPVFKNDTRETLRERWCTAARQDQENPEERKRWLQIELESDAESTDSELTPALQDT